MILPVAFAIAFTVGGVLESNPVAQTAAGSYLEPGAVSGVAYRPGLALDAYAPAGDPRPAAIVIHGASGSRSTHVNQLFDVLRRAGYAWFSVDYRSLGDVRDAERYIRRPGRFNITDDLVLVGVDTGGQIALDLARQSHVKGVVTFGIKPKPGDSPPPDCPVLMFHGSADDEVPVAEAETLCRKMAHCDFRAVQGAIHDFENWRPAEWGWKEDLTAWLRFDRRGLWKDITYSRPCGRDLLMDGWIPTGAGPFPAVIIMHGGGWEAGDKVTYVSPAFEPLARAGLAWFSIDYRLTPYVHVAEQLEDLRNAIRYVRRHAARFHVDPNRIAILGESASGQLVAQAGSEPCPGCEVQAIVSFYGVYDFLPWSSGEEWQRSRLTQLFGSVTADVLRKNSPIASARRDMPPVLLIQGTKDELAKGTGDYAAKLKEVGASYELVLLQGAPHGMENWEGHPEWMFYKHKLVDWLRSVLSAR
jgi:acetyl esterase/lipase